MSRRCSASSARRLVNSYVNEVQRQLEDIQKNFEDMDFENADARNEVEHIIKGMVSNCRSLIGELNSYRFE